MDGASIYVFSPPADTVSACWYGTPFWTFMQLIFSHRVSACMLSGPVAFNTWVRFDDSARSGHSRPDAFYPFLPSLFSDHSAWSALSDRICFDVLNRSFYVNNENAKSFVFHSFVEFLKYLSLVLSILYTTPLSTVISY